MVLSYSKLGTYEKCPQKYKFRYIEKLEEPKATAASRGTEVHGTIEDFLNRQREDLHPDIHQYYGSFFTSLREAGGKPEVKFCLDKDWKPTEWDNPDALIRGVLDTLLQPEGTAVTVFEYKTGKMYPDHQSQSELYGIAALAIHPEVEEARVTNIYLDLRRNSTMIQPRYYQEAKIEHWNKRLGKVLKDEEFIPNPSYACRFCHFRKENGGPCSF